MIIGKSIYSFFIFIDLKRVGSDDDDVKLFQQVTT